MQTIGTSKMQDWMQQKLVNIRGHKPFDPILLAKPSKEQHGALECLDKPTEENHE